MVFSVLADLLVALHLAFVLFVLFGALLLLRWPRLVWLHLPAATWGVVVEWAGWVCPLTPLEQWLRMKGGTEGYRGAFVEQYVLPLLYPSGLTPAVQVMLGATVVAVNVLLYGLIFLRPHRRSRNASRTDAAAPP